MSPSPSHPVLSDNAHFATAIDGSLRCIVCSR